MLYVTQQMSAYIQKNMRIRNDIKIEQYDNAGNVVAMWRPFSRWFPEEILPL